MKSISFSLKSILGSTIVSLGLWSVISMSAHTAYVVSNTVEKTEEIAMVTIHDYTSELNDLSNELAFDDGSAQELYMEFSSGSFNDIASAAGDE